jgi:hypothetical protein
MFNELVDVEFANLPWPAVPAVSFTVGSVYATAEVGRSLSVEAPVEFEKPVTGVAASQ